METTYTHTTWHVQHGREEEFVKRWREWVDWSRREGFEAQALLLRDLEAPEARRSRLFWVVRPRVPAPARARRS
jgi:hypothetical protein